MRNLSKEDLPCFQTWLQTRAVVTCPMCMGEFRFPDTAVKFVEDEGNTHGSPFRFDASPLNIACATPKCRWLISIDPGKLNNGYKKYRQSKS